MSNNSKAMRAYFAKQRESRKIFERILESDSKYIQSEIEFADADLIIDNYNKMKVLELC